MTISPKAKSINFRATRRTAMKLIATLPFAALFLPGRALARRTPSTTEGPFYPLPEMRFDDADNILVKIEGTVKASGGEVIILSGQVYDRKGNPVLGARVEIWQCDATGRYLHFGDNRPNPRDAGFQGFGHDCTDCDGR